MMTGLTFLLIAATFTSIPHSLVYNLCSSSFQLRFGMLCRATTRTDTGFCR